MATQTRTFSGGITFTGRFRNQAEADEMVGTIEKYLTLELGLQLARGGAAETDKSICDCESAGDCDEGVGCLFVPFPD
jgi:hypothetical protein